MIVERPTFWTVVSLSIGLFFGFASLFADIRFVGEVNRAALYGNGVLWVSILVAVGVRTYRRRGAMRKRHRYQIMSREHEVELVRNAAGQIRAKHKRVSKIKALDNGTNKVAFKWRIPDKSTINPTGLLTDYQARFSYDRHAETLPESITKTFSDQRNLDVEVRLPRSLNRGETCTLTDELTSASSYDATDEYFRVTLDVPTKMVRIRVTFPTGYTPIKATHVHEPHDGSNKSGNLKLAEATSNVFRVEKTWRNLKVGDRLAVLWTI